MNDNRFVIHSNQLKELDVSENTQLIRLSCIGNSLTQLDLANNTDLVVLEIADNQLTEIDLSAAKSIEVFYAFENLLTQIDLSNQVSLKKLWISGNQLTELDVSKNSMLETLNVNRNKINELDISYSRLLTVISATSNDLFSLNLANGNNAAITTMATDNNPNLSCIQIDEGFTPPNTWSKDIRADYSINCSVTTSFDKKISAEFEMYPNPVSHTVYIENAHNAIDILKLDVCDLTGRLVSGIDNPIGARYEIDTSHLKCGIYILKITTNKGLTSKQFVKQ